VFPHDATAPASHSPRLLPGGHESGRLRIIATSDLHLHIFPWDYATDRPAPWRGLARAVPVIERLKAEVPLSLLLDNGDFLQGSAIGDDFAARFDGAQRRRHPMIAVMNRLGYDAATLGNHEFNFGLELLEAAIAEAGFPVVNANLTRLPGRDPFVAPYALLTRKLPLMPKGETLLRVGITGALPPQVLMWDRRWLEGRLGARGIVESVRERVAQLRAEGADIVVVLCHSGLGRAHAGRMAENAARAVAALPGVDAVIAGHSHMVFPASGLRRMIGVDAAAGMVAGRPLVMPGFGASHLGVIDLTLGRARPDAEWRVEESQSRSVEIGIAAQGTKPSRSTLALARTDHEATVSSMRRHAGETTVPLSTRFAVITPSEAVRIVARAQAWQIALRAEGSALAGLPVLSAAAPFRAGGIGGPGNFVDIPAGPLLMRHLADLCPYPNTVAALVLAGAEIRAWLERATALFAPVIAGRTGQRLLRADRPVYGFDLIEGLEYEIDLGAPGQTHPEGRRIARIMHAGRPVEDDARFLVAVNSYRAAGGGGFPGTGAGRAILDRGPTMREVLEAFLRATGPYAPDPSPVWRFAPMPGASVWFDTMPAADNGADGGERAELTREGFARMHLDL
jgi:2',3'-cyclic-nucleotide 2'-phosphodiesterase/3'-nucleotidase